MDDSGEYTQEEDWMQLGTRRTVFSLDRQGKTRQYSYDAGFWDPATATFSPFSGPVQALRTTVIHGVVGALGGIANQTTIDVAVEDTVGHLVLQESYVSDGQGNAVALIDRTVHAYTGSRLTATWRNGRLSYEAGYYPDGKVQWEEDESGRRTEYAYDEMKRVHQKIVRGRGGDADQVFTYDYDVLGHVTSETRTAGALSVQVQSLYDLAGELVATVGIDGLTNAVSTSYANGFKVTTETLPTLATRVTSFFKDRQMRSVTGTAVEDEYHDPFLALWWPPASYREAVAVYRDSGLTQFKELRVVNWVGSEILSQTPKFRFIREVPVWSYEG